jgi:hypothetical protein
VFLGTKKRLFDKKLLAFTHCCTAARVNKKGCKLWHLKAARVKNRA